MRENKPTEMIWKAVKAMKERAHFILLKNLRSTAIVKGRFIARSRCSLGMQLWARNATMGVMAVRAVQRSPLNHEHPGCGNKYIRNASPYNRMRQSNEPADLSARREIESKSLVSDLYTSGSLRFSTC